MKKILVGSAVLSTVTFILLPSAFAKRAPAAASPSASAGTAANSAASPAGRSKHNAFHGMVASVDEKAKTFTITSKKDNSRVFKLSDQTVIMKAGAPATIKDVVQNEEVRGSYWKEADGSLVVKALKLGPLTEQEKAAKEARKARRAERTAAAAAASPGASATAAPTASPKP